ncbi:MAG: hypothetical protein AB7V39_00625 [Nitrospiraceae bacterium]
MDRREFFYTRHGRRMLDVCQDAIREGATKSELLLLAVAVVAKAARVMDKEAQIKNEEGV